MHVLVQSIVDGLVFGAVYAIAGVTFGLVYETTKVFHIAFGSIGTLGTYVAVWIAGAGSGVGALVGTTLVGMLVGGAATIVVVSLVYQPLVRRGAGPGATFVASLGLSFVIEAVVVLVFGPNNRSFAVNAFVRQHDVAGYGISWYDGVVVAIAIVLIGCISLLLNRTRAGHQVRAVASNREQAQLVGIRTGIVTLVVCGLASAVAIISFVLLAMHSSVVATGGTQLTLFAILAVIAGGVGSIAGTASVGVAIGALNGITASLLPGDSAGAWSTTIVFALVLVLILARPSGLVRRAAGVKT
jgi:branched-chain amino acid transport system permease protein